MKQSFVILLIGLMLQNDGHSQSSMKKGARLTGHEQQEAVVIKTCDIIVVARFASIGSASPDSAGTILYENALIVVSTSIKGVLSGTAKVAYIIQQSPEAKRETCPEIGKDYVLFIKTVNPGELRIVKVVEAADDTVQRIVSILRKS